MILESELIYAILALCIVGPILILLLIALIIALVKKTKLIKKYKNVNPDEIENVSVNNELISAFGEKNILDVTIDMSRVTISVKDINIVDANKIKESGAKGVLLVGNNVKCSFDENAKDIYNQLKGAIDNE